MSLSPYELPDPNEYRVPCFSRAEAEKFARDLYGLEVRVRPLGSYCDQNFLLEDADGREYVLKFSVSSDNADDIDFQNRVLELLAGVFERDAVPRVILTRDDEEMTEIPGIGPFRHILRLLSWVPGVRMAEVTPHTPDLLESLGTFLGQLDQVLAGYTHPAMHRGMRWDLRRSPQTIRENSPSISDPARRALVEHFLGQYETHLPPVEHELRRAVIHNDANDHNVVVGHTASGRQKIDGIFDFGDIVHTWGVAELAIAVSYAMMGKAEPLEAAARVVAGYHTAYPLTDPELVVLFDLICARLAMSVSISAHDRVREPDNTYISVSEEPAWELLEKFVQVPRGLAYDTFRRACRMSSPSPSAADITPSPSLPRDEILERRQRHLAPSLSLSYRRPLEIVRGFMQYLYDEKGRVYLDCVNNVCHVGHCHPRVVRAAQDQMAVLNTNTRYLHENLARYAERLASTLPDPLEVCFFVCSGSEANDLALRLARAHTGNHGVVVVDGAYHGNLTSLIELSPYKYDGPGGAGRSPHVHPVPMPDVYRGPHQGEDAGRRYAEHVAAAADEARRLGQGPAAFFCESMLGCGGQIVPPPGYLEAAYAHVRSAGGVVVADEVQVGFGRAGSHFWAFELDGVVPDIVTLGKPIGNGHPMAAVVTTREIAASFANGMEYFNTFGGNPVSCAVGLAVLDTIADDRLQENARRVGTYFLARLKKLRDKHALVGDVRGRGLFLGVELVRDRDTVSPPLESPQGDTLEPAADEAGRIVEKMKEEGILLSTDGPLHNVIKIKPPLVFSAADADRVVDSLDEILAS